MMMMTIKRMRTYAIIDIHTDLKSLTTTLLWLLHVTEKECEYSYEQRYQMNVSLDPATFRLHYGICNINRISTALYGRNFRGANKNSLHIYDNNLIFNIVLYYYNDSITKHHKTCT